MFEPQKWCLFMTGKPPMSGIHPCHRVINVTTSISLDVYGFPGLHVVQSDGVLLRRVLGQVLHWCIHLNKLKQRCFSTLTGPQCPVTTQPNNTKLVGKPLVLGVRHLWTNLDVNMMEDPNAWATAKFNHVFFQLWVASAGRSNLTSCTARPSGITLPCLEVTTNEEEINTNDQPAKHWTNKKHEASWSAGTNQRQTD